MTISSQTIVHKRLAEISPSRKLAMGVIEVLTAILIFFVFSRSITSDAMTKFVMTPGGITIGIMADWIFNSSTALNLLAGFVLLIGLYQLIKGFGKLTNLMVGITFFCLIFAFLAWQASGKSLNLGGMLSSAVLLAVPITLAAFSGILSERSGVVNIAIEGMMLMSCMTAAIVASVTKNVWLGLLGGILSAVLLAWIHAFLSIKYKINQVISGTVINLFYLSALPTEK
jgi:uncharacterized membrane protein